MKIHEISPAHLTIDDIRRIVREGYQLKLSEESVRRIQACRDYLDNKMKTQKEPIYGVTTGFGSLCNISVGADELSQLQKNLVMSHACGTGDEVDREIVKIIIFLKIQSLQYGVSGVQVATVQRLVDMFNAILGWLPGGLAIAAFIASAFFGAIFRMLIGGSGAGMPDFFSGAI